jgi:uncharacterized protein (TIGR03000 family)
MRKLFLIAVLSVAGLALNTGRASAWWGWAVPPQPASYAFPMVYPPGWYTNTYYFPWGYPWYANYNYSHGSYANWWAWRGWAFYEGQPIPANFRIGPNGAYFLDPPAKVDPKQQPAKKDPAAKKEPAKKAPGKVSISLPADARLTFNGVVAAGTGDSRTFVTPDLESGRDYEYVLTAEVVRAGQTMTATERVIVRAGSVTEVALAPAATVSK